MNKSRIFLATSIIAILLLAAFLLQSPPPPEARSNEAPQPQTAHADHEHHDHVHHYEDDAMAKARHKEAARDFKQWLAQEDRKVSEQVRTLAQNRRERMRWLIQNDPEQAIAEAVSWTEHQRVPAALKPYVEQPFSEVATLQALPICDLDHDHHDHPSEVYTLVMDGQSYSAGVYGRRLNVGTKEGASLQGIVLDDLAAIREEVIQPLSAEDAQTLAGLPLLNPRPELGFATGKPLDASSVTALAGDRLLQFVDRQALDQFNSQLAALEEYPGPKSGAEYALAMPYPADGATEGFDFEAAYQAAEELADAWTETEKTVFFIRVEFPDVPGASVSQAVLDQILDTDVTDNIFDQSLGKTFITADVSAQLVTMPSNSTVYTAIDAEGTSQNSLLHNDAKAAFNALNTGINLNDYDIIGVHFASIGMQAGGLNYSGLATRGGSNQWLQGTTSSETIVHEFGHNYGLEHARAWNTSDGSVLGTGTSVEYGDVSDIMGDGPFSEGFFHGQARDRLNWFEDEVHWTDATAAGSGTYRLYTMDDAATTQPLRSVRVTRAANEYFWIGYRRNLDDSWFDNGAYLVWQQAGRTSGWLMDTTPDSEPTTTADAEDAPLLMGRTFSDSDIHITPIGLGGAAPDEWLDVHIEFGPFPGNQAPSATIDGPTSVPARSTVVYTASATDPDGDTLAYFWDSNDETIHLDVNAIAQTFNTSGTYDIEVIVSDRKGETVTATTTVTVTDPLDTWTQRTSGASGELRDICIGGNDRLVTVGQDFPNFRGEFRYSDDGVTWNGGIFGINEHLHSVIWDGSQFVAVGQDFNNDINEWEGIVMTSADGTSWTKQFQGAEAFNDVYFDGTTYIAVGDDGAIYTSTNLVNWTSRSISTTDNFNAVTFGNGVYIAVGGQDNSINPMVYTSPDTVTWTDFSSGANTPQALFDIEYIVDRFYASGFAADLLDSTDNGQTFDSDREDREQIEAFLYGNETYFATGQNRDASDVPVTLISLDGVNWTEITSPAATDIKSGVFYNDTFLLVGENGEIWQSNTFAGPSADDFVAWQLQNFNMVGDEGSAIGDFEKDGLPNLYEYFAGGDPTQPNPELAPVLIWNNGFTYTLPEDTNVSGLSVSVVKSNDMTTWTPATFTDVSTTPGEVILDVTDVPTPGTPLFLSIEVTED